MSDKKPVKRRELLENGGQVNQEQPNPGHTRRSYIHAAAISIFSTFLAIFGLRSSTDPVAADEKKEDISSEKVREVLQRYKTEIEDFHAVGMLDFPSIDRLVENSIEVDEAYVKVKETDSKTYRVLHLPFSGPEGGFWIRFGVNSYNFGIPDQEANFQLKPFIKNLKEDGEGPILPQEDEVTIQQTDCLCEDPVGCCEYGVCGVCSDGPQCNPPPVYCRCACGAVPVECDGENMYSYYCDVCSSHPWCSTYCPNSFLC